MNTRNFGIAEGRLTRNPAILMNKDGSAKVKLTIAAQDNFQNKDSGKRGSQFINLDAFVRAEKVDTCVYNAMHEGDLICAHYTVKTNNYKDADGKDVYDQILQIQEVDLRESKSVTDARAAKKAAEAAGETSAPVEAMDADAPFEG